MFRTCFISAALRSRHVYTDDVCLPLFLLSFIPLSRLPLLPHTHKQHHKPSKVLYILRGLMTSLPPSIPHVPLSLGALPRGYTTASAICSTHTRITNCSRCVDPPPPPPGAECVDIETVWTRFNPPSPRTHGRKERNADNMFLKFVSHERVHNPAPPFVLNWNRKTN